MGSDVWAQLRRGWLQLAAACACACLNAGAQLASAQPQPTPAERETARSLMQDGDQRFAAADYVTALARYTAAHALMHLPTTGLEVARTQAKLGRLVEARGLSLEIANGTSIAGEPRVFARARSAAAELASELEARIPSLRTLVQPAAAAYSLTIDGITLPREARAVAFRTDPGPHVVAIAATGYVAQRREITLAERQAATLSVTLAPAQGTIVATPLPTPAPGRGTLAH